tara:strand:- start:3357 stop:3752 length:396 start_codon:yes stop_codon:yes gene_type:complete
MSRRVEALFDQGGSIAEACREMGISRSTFAAWSKSTDAQKSAFRDTVKMGKEASEAWWIRQGRENLDTRGFNHGLWLLNMVNRFGWNSNRREEKKEIEHKGTVEVKKKVDVEAILDKAVNRGIEDVTKSIH